MCRYGFNTYKEHFACFACRKAFKQRFDQPEAEAFPAAARESLCPECGQPMAPMGRDFQAPKQSNKVQWKKAEILFLAQLTFGGCGCGCGSRPDSLSELPQFLRENLPISPGEAMANRILTDETRPKILRSGTKIRMEPELKSLFQNPARRR